MVIYREIEPSAALADRVERFWWLEGPAELLGADPIPPDGRVELILHAGDRFVAEGRDGRWTPQARLLVAGQATGPVAVRPQGHARVFGVRLRPNAARIVTGVPAHELTGGIFDLGAVAPRLARAVATDVADLPTPEAIAAAFEAVLTPMSSGGASPRPSAAVDLALASRGLCRVDDLARRVGLSARQLEREFREHVGLSPKQFLRVIRFQRVLGALGGRRADVTWARLAADHGFYDQAHLIRDFQTFLGTSPGAWHADPSSLSTVFSALGRQPA